MKISIREEIKNLIAAVKTLDKKVVIIFLSVAIAQTVSYYYASRKFFRNSFFIDYFSSDPNYGLYEYLYWFVSEFGVYILTAIIVIKILLKEKFRAYGFQFGDYKVGLKMTALFLAVMLPLLWFASAMPDFSVKYPHLQMAKTDWTIFYVFEIGMFLYMVSWEFAWRGLMLFGLEEKFGYYAVLIQMIPFLILHNGKPVLETFGAIPGGIALGILALRTRSFYYCVLVHFGVMFSIDLISTLRFRAGDYGWGLNSVLHIISNIF
ncbi:MAG: CPBP family intramembrane glutamic endopeptidase [bacterium]